MSGGSCSAVLLGEDTKSAGGLVSAAGGEGLLEEKVCWGRRSAGGVTKCGGCSASRRQ